LGAQWLATYPASALKGQMEYYIEPAEQTDEVKSQLAAISPETLNPEDLTLIDPACGSGHILAEAYELFKAIYLERGYQLREIPQLILQKNLYGLDIDERAAQLTSFALMMKGREDDRRLFECGVKLNVMALQNSASVNVERLAANVDLATAGVSRADVLMLVELFAHASTSGSLIEVPSVLADKLPALKRLAEQSSQDLFASGELQQLEALARQADALSRRYDSVVANPPYMGSKYLSGELKEYVKYSYPDSKGDVFACFIDRSTTLAKTTGRIGIVAPYVWMFIASYQKLREKLIANTAFDTLIQLEYNAFEPAMVPVASFTLLNQHVPGVFGAFIRLSDFKGSQNQSPKVLEAISNPECGWFHRACADSFLRMPGSPIGYWITELMIQAFSGPSLGEIFAPSAGITTGNNAKYLRLWHELNAGSILHDLIPGQQPPAHGFVPHMKGGSFRRWYGNFDYCLAFSTQSIASMQKEKGYRPDGAEHFFKPMLSWSKLTVGPFSARYVRGGAAFDTTGTSGFSCSSLMRIIGLLNSKVAQDILDLLNPTLTYLPRDIKSIPWVEVNSEIPSQCVKLCIKDWNAFERSWEFKASPLVSRPDQQKSTLSTANDAWTEECKQATRELKHLEESNNIDYIHAYGLDGQLSPLVAIDAVTLTGNPAYRYGANLSEKEQWSRFRRDTMAEFLSYATGCMMGRYSLDQPGLILADSRESQATHLAAYEEKVGKPLAEVRFKPDPDAILPVLDGEWFEDDIVARTREFLEVTFPESTVTENLRFIEESLGKDIRKYFCTDFYKDHLQTYKKRPIYWMVQSPKKGFACLIYLHRYTKDTLNQVLNNYFRPYLQKLEARLAQLGLDQLNDDLPTRERTAARKEAEKITKVLRECQVWEKDALLPLAQQRIELDLDDGVKVNYLKLQDVLAPIPGLAAKED
jgi:type II restriction/modification system DNA methylase subunit YeeA